jgi:hypothetical protein
MFYKAEPYLEVDDETAAKALKAAARLKYAQLKAELKQFARLHPGELPVGIGMRDVSARRLRQHTS